MASGARGLLFGGGPASGAVAVSVPAASGAALALAGAADAPPPSREERWLAKQRLRSQQAAPQAQASVSNAASIPAPPGRALPAVWADGDRGTLADRLKGGSGGGGGGGGDSADGGGAGGAMAAPLAPQPLPPLPRDTENRFVQQLAPVPSARMVPAEPPPFRPFRHALVDIGGAPSATVLALSQGDSPVRRSRNPAYGTNGADTVPPESAHHSSEGSSGRGGDVIGGPGVLPGAGPVHGHVAFKAAHQTRYAEELAEQVRTRKVDEAASRQREREEASAHQGVLPGNGGRGDGGSSGGIRGNGPVPPSTGLPAAQPSHFLSPGGPASSRSVSAAGPGRRKELAIAYADELEQQVRARDEARARVRDEERAAARRSAGIGAIIAAADHHGRELQQVQTLLPPPKSSDSSVGGGTRDARSALGQAGASALRQPPSVPPRQLQSWEQAPAQERQQASAARSPLQQEADDREHSTAGPLAGSGSRAPLDQAAKAAYAVELQRQIEEREAVRVRSKLDALNPHHVPDGRQLSRAVQLQLQVRAEQRRQQQQPYSQPPWPQLSSGDGDLPMPPVPQLASRDGGSIAAFSPPRLDMPRNNAAEDLARRRLQYAAELEHQVEAAKARKASERQVLDEAERRLERDALEHTRVQAARKALGGNGEPLRDSSGRVIAAVRGTRSAAAAAAAAVAAVAAIAAASPPRPAPTLDRPHGFRDDLWGEAETLRPQLGVLPLALPVGVTTDDLSASAPGFARVAGGGLVAGLSPDQQVRRARMGREMASALAQQIEDRERRKTEETQLRRREEAAEEERLGRERLEMAARYEKEERERREGDDDEHRKALASQIDAKNRAKHDAEASERELEARAEAKFKRQQQELAFQFSSGGEGASRSPGQQSSLAPAVSSGSLPYNAARRAELFGRSSPPSASSGPSGPFFFPAPATRLQDEMIAESPRQPAPQPPSVPFTYQQQQLAWTGESRPLPAQSPAPVQLPPQPHVQERIAQAEAELQRLSSAMAALQLQSRDADFVAGIERVGLHLPGAPAPHNERPRLELFPEPAATVGKVARMQPPLRPTQRPSDELGHGDNQADLDVSLGGTSRLLHTSQLFAPGSSMRSLAWDPHPSAAQVVRVRPAPPAQAAFVQDPGLILSRAAETPSVRPPSPLARAPPPGGPPVQHAAGQALLDDDESDAGEALLSSSFVRLSRPQAARLHSQAVDSQLDASFSPPEFLHVSRYFTQPALAPSRSEGNSKGSDGSDHSSLQALLNANLRRLASLEEQESKSVAARPLSAPALEQVALDPASSRPEARPPSLNSSNRLDERLEGRQRANGGSLGVRPQDRDLDSESEADASPRLVDRRRPLGVGWRRGTGVLDDEAEVSELQRLRHWEVREQLRAESRPRHRDSEEERPRFGEDRGPYDPYAKSRYDEKLGARRRPLRVHRSYVEDVEDEPVARRRPPRRRWDGL